MFQYLRVFRSYVVLQKIAYCSEYELCHRNSVVIAPYIVGISISVQIFRLRSLLCCNIYKYLGYMQSNSEEGVVTGGPIKKFRIKNKSFLKCITSFLIEKVIRNKKFADMYVLMQDQTSKNSRICSECELCQKQYTH